MKRTIYNKLYDAICSAIQTCANQIKYDSEANMNVTNSIAILNLIEALAKLEQNFIIEEDKNDT